MTVLLPFILPAVLFLALELLWSRPAWLHAPAAAPAAAWGPGEVAGPFPIDPLLIDRDPFALPFMRSRMAALLAELERLDHDRTVFARAFRTRVAQAAYDALLADTSRLAAVTTMEMELCRARGPLGEELEV